MAQDKIGMRLRSLREELGLGLDELAARTGLNLGLLQAIEDGQAVPALGPLVKIARALGCRLGTLLDDVQTKDPHIVRREEREKDFALQLAAGGAAAQSYFSLGKGKSDRHMEPFYIELAPEQARPAELSAHEGEEFIVVLSGRVHLTYGKQEYELAPGDSMFYNSIVPHHVAAVGGEKASIFAVVYVPF